MVVRNNQVEQLQIVLDERRRKLIFAVSIVDRQQRRPLSGIKFITEGLEERGLFINSISIRAVANCSRTGAQITCFSNCVHGMLQRNAILKNASINFL